MGEKTKSLEIKGIKRKEIGELVSKSRWSAP